MAKLNVPYVLMQNNKSWETMHETNSETNIIDTVIDFLEENAIKLRELGADKIILDPGFGFGKTMEQNYILLAKLHLFQFVEGPLLIGISRKSLITSVLNIKPEDAVSATSALHFFCLNKWAKILRVHDVKEAKQTALLLRMFKDSNSG